MLIVCFLLCQQSFIRSSNNVYGVDVQMLNPAFKEEPLDLRPEDSLVVISEYEWNQKLVNIIPIILRSNQSSLSTVIQSAGAAVDGLNSISKLKL